MISTKHYLRHILLFIKAQPSHSDREAEWKMCHYKYCKIIVQLNNPLLLGGFKGPKAYPHLSIILMRMFSSVHIFDCYFFHLTRQIAQFHRPGPGPLLALDLHKTLPTFLWESNTYESRWGSFLWLPLSRRCICSRPLVCLMVSRITEKVLNQFWWILVLNPGINDFDREGIYSISTSASCRG